MPEEEDLHEYFTLVYFGNSWTPAGRGGTSWAGHPHNAEWFCWEHAEAATELAHLDAGEAIDRLRERFQVTQLWCAQCGAPAARIEVIGPGGRPTQWDQWGDGYRDAYRDAFRRRDHHGWYLYYDGPDSGSGSGLQIEEDRAKAIAAAFVLPLSYERVRSAEFYDDAGVCTDCNAPYCARHWNITHSGYGTCPHGHGKSLDPHWSPEELWPEDR